MPHKRSKLYHFTSKPLHLYSLSSLTAVTSVFLFANLLPVTMHFPCVEKFSHYFQIEIPMWFKPTIRILGAQPGQELFQFCTLSGELDAVFVGNVPLQFCHKSLIFPLVGLLIGAFAGELPVGILSHIAHLLEAAIPVRLDLCKRIRVRQRSQIDFFSLRNQPCAEVYKAVITAVMPLS